MQRDTFETQWPQIREVLRTRFSELTDEDIRQINGRYDQLLAKLQQRYNISREEAEDKLRGWNFDKVGTRETIVTRDEKYRREDGKVKKEESSDLFKWLLGLGIPLLLIGAYLLNMPKETTRETEVVRTPQVTTQHVVTETAADRAISNGLRSALLTQQGLALPLQNVQITTNNGVVTLSGVVADREIRDFIEATAKNFSGVRQVVNNLQVR